MHTNKWDMTPEHKGPAGLHSVGWNTVRVKPFRIIHAGYVNVCETVWRFLVKVAREIEKQHMIKGVHWQSSLTALTWRVCPWPPRYETLAVATDAESRQDPDLPLKSGGKRLTVSPEVTPRAAEDTHFSHGSRFAKKNV